MPRGVTEIVEPTLERAMYDLRWYANGLCKVKPERYEVFQDRSGTTALSDSCRVVLDALAARTREVEGMREALTHYANSINWMTHTDQDDDNLRRVWVGSGDGREYARRALAAQEGTNGH